MAYGANLAQLSDFVNKMYWNTALPIRLDTLPMAALALKQQLNSCKAD